MTALFCPKCGAETTGEFKFCPNCGNKLPEDAAGKEQVDNGDRPGEREGDQQGRPEGHEVLRCPTCGFVNESGARSCESCGSFLGAAETEYVEGPVSTLQPSSNQVKKETPGKQAAHRKAGKKGQKHQSKKQSVSASQGFHLETYQTVAIIAAVIIGGIFIYGLMSSKQAPPIGEAPPSQQTSSSGQPSAEVIHEINRLKQVVNKEPNDLGSVLKLSNMLQDNGFYDQAAIYYKRYLSKVPDNVDARVDYGVTLFEGGNAKEAITEIKDALKINPRHQIGLFNLGIIYLNEGNLGEANAAFKKCVKVDPSSEVGQKAEQALEEHAKITSQEVN